MKSKKTIKTKRQNKYTYKFSIKIHISSINNIHVLHMENLSIIVDTNCSHDEIRNLT